MTTPSSHAFRTRLGTALGLAGATLLLVGCGKPNTTIQRQSSLMEYLSPAADKIPAPESHGPATVRVPMVVGVAFVPCSNSRSTSFWNGNADAVFLAPESERRLAGQFQASLAGKPWIGSLRMIPSSDLAGNGGGQGLEKVAALNHVEAMILIAVNQVQVSHPKASALAYWTGVGGYVVRGDKNDTSTLLDAGVYHVASHSLLCRAEATSLVQGSSSWNKRDQRLQESSLVGLSRAMEVLVVNLDQAAAAFQEDVALGRRDDVRLLDRDGLAVAQVRFGPAKS